VRAKGALSAKTAQLMVFQLSKIVQGIKFQNGIEVIESPAHHAA
jgi:hypothetical protein